VNSTSTPLSPTQERNLAYNVQHGVASVLAANLAAPFFGIFALKLGATNTQVALLSSGPAIISLLVMIPGAFYVDRFPRKKRVTTAFLLANRFFYLALACVPFFTSDYRAGALVVAVAVMNLPGAIGNVAWQAFISRVIPPAQRARAFARRNRWMNLVGTAAVVVAGRALDVMSFPVGYQVMFVLAFVAAMVEIRIFQRLEEPPDPATATLDGPAVSAVATVPGATPDAAGAEKGGLLAGLGRVLRAAGRDLGSHPRFIQYTLASVVFYFSWQIAWPLFTLYQVKVLGANNLWISVLQLANTGGALVGYGFWAAFADRHGHLKSLVVATTGICFVPFYYAFSHSLMAISVLNLATGVVFSGVNLALFNALLESTPESHSTRYIAYYNTAIALTTIVAPLAGVGLLRVFNYMWAFLFCAGLRTIGSFSFYLVLRSRRAASASIGRSGGISEPGV
jgi:MFS family permease